MKNLLLSLMFLFPASVATAQDKPDKPAKQGQTVQQQIEDLIDQLKHDSYEIREKAHLALEKIGKPALEALRKAVKSADLEVAGRAQELIEKITGKSFEPETKPKPRDTPSPVPSVPEEIFDPKDMKEILEKLEGLGELSPGLKKTLESVQKLLEGDKGTFDLDEIGKLFGQFFNNKPETPDPKSEQSEQSEIEKELGLRVRPIDEALRRHLYILERSGGRPPVALKYGLVLETVDVNGHAWKQGLRPYDIIIFIGTEPGPKVSLPGPEVDWNKWRAKSLIAGKAEKDEFETPICWIRGRVFHYKDGKIP